MTITLAQSANGTYRVAPKLHFKPATTSALKALASGQMTLENIVLLPLED